MAKTPKEGLKKSDLLAALKDNKGDNRTDLTKESLQASLARKFEFIPEFFNYLYATYLGAGKFEEGEDGILVIRDMGQVRTGPRTMYQCTVNLSVKDEAGNYPVALTTDTLKPGDKLPEGWSLSTKSAAKLGYQKAYADYKVVRETLEDWAANVEADKAAA